MSTRKRKSGIPRVMKLEAMSRDGKGLAPKITNAVKPPKVKLPQAKVGHVPKPGVKPIKDKKTPLPPKPKKKGV